MFLFARGYPANNLFKKSVLVCPTSVDLLLWMVFPLPLLLICVLSNMFEALSRCLCGPFMCVNPHTPYTLTRVLCVLLISVYVLRLVALFFPCHKKINNKGVCKYYISRFVKFREQTYHYNICPGEQIFKNSSKVEFQAGHFWGCFHFLGHLQFCFFLIFLVIFIF